MGIEEFTLYHVTVTGKLTVKAKNEEEALQLGKELLQSGDGDFTWTIDKEVVDVAVA